MSIELLCLSSLFRESPWPELTPHRPDVCVQFGWPLLWCWASILTRSSWNLGNGSINLYPTPLVPQNLHWMNEDTKSLDLPLLFSKFSLSHCSHYQTLNLTHPSLRSRLWRIERYIWVPCTELTKVGVKGVLIIIYVTIIRDCPNNHHNLVFYTWVYGVCLGICIIHEIFVLRNNVTNMFTTQSLDSYVFTITITTKTLLIVLLSLSLPY